MERSRLAILAIALLLSLIDGSGADPFRPRGAPRSLLRPGGGGSGGGGSGSSSGSGGGSSGSGSGGGSGGGSGSGSGSESSSGPSSGGGGGSASNSGASSGSSTTEEEGSAGGWLSEFFGGGDPSESLRSAVRRSAAGPWPLLGAGLTAFVAGLAFVIARRSCRGDDDEDERGSGSVDGPPRRRWRRGARGLTRRVAVGDASHDVGQPFVEMAWIPKGGSLKAFASGVRGAKRAEDATGEEEVREAAGCYEPAPDGLSSPVDVTRSASAASYATTSSDSSASMVIV